MKITLALLVLACCALAQATFEGQWTDEVDGGGYGISNYICVDGNNLYGFYSELGIMRGTISGNTAIGHWYQGGLTLNYGSFSITLADNDNSWSGTWNYDGSDEDFEWENTRIDDDEPSTEQCFRPDVVNTNMNGMWATDDYNFNSLCDTANGEDYESHYQYVLTQDGDAWFIYGRDFGSCRDNLCQGQWWEAIDGEPITGTSLWGRQANGDLVTTWWTYPIEDDVSDTINDDEEHGIDYFESRLGNVHDCSPAATLSASLASLVAAVAIAMKMF